MALKVATWNLKHADRLVDEAENDHMTDRRRRVFDTILQIDPDILCLIEGPRGEQAISDFCAEVFEYRYAPVLLKQQSDGLGDRDREYHIKGTQWIWFVVKIDLLPRCKLQSPTVWQSFTKSKSWPVNYWGEEIAKTHSHYRHPQVMLYTLDGGQQIELIGAHLKSKINQKMIKWDDKGNLTGDYVTEAMECRVKLATEAHDIRRYIGAKFEQLPSPGILVMGDCNDGPGQDHFETRYLFFDLIGNLQGEVLMAERFFNHALFDFPNHLRWTARYDDKIENKKARDNPLLLDHILISQALCRGELPLVVNTHAGKVEHEAFERANAGANNKTRTSDHRPVSCVLGENEL